jgi:hypothetical protein
MVGARATIGLGHQHTHKAEFAELGERLCRKPRLTVPLRGKRREAAAGKVAGDIAQHKLLVGEPHSKTSSARLRMDGGIVKPSAAAVFRLTTSSNLVGCSIGRSLGLAPLRILST